MGALSSKLRSVGFGTAGTGIAFWCPGCNEVHRIRTEGPGGQFNQAKWQWDGNVAAPTISPSILIRVNFAPEDGGPIVCHSFVRAGQIEFLGDCTHALKGQTVALPDWPQGSP
jgi:hypothetical protein